MTTKIEREDEGMSRHAFFGLFGQTPPPGSEIVEQYVADERESILAAAYAQRQSAPPLNDVPLSKWTLPPRERASKPIDCRECGEGYIWVRFGWDNFRRCQPCEEGGEGWQIAWSEKGECWFAVEGSIRPDRIVHDQRWVLHRHQGRGVPA